MGSPEDGSLLPIPGAAVVTEGRRCQPRSGPAASRREASQGLVPAPRGNAPLPLLSQPGFAQVPASEEPRSPGRPYQAPPAPVGAPSPDPSARFPPHRVAPHRPAAFAGLRAVPPPPQPPAAEERQEGG